MDFSSGINYSAMKEWSAEWRVEVDLQLMAGFIKTYLHAACSLQKYAAVCVLKKKKF